MKPSRITAALGVVLIGLGIYVLTTSILAGLIPTVIGASLVYLALSKSRVATLVFGHVCIVVGAYMITWGILLLPHSEPTIGYVFGRPLFWGIFSLMGGICANFHGFCRCINKQVDQFENRL